MSISYTEFVQAVFRGALGRDIASNDLTNFVQGLRNGYSLSQMISDVVSSEEFNNNLQSSLVVKLPSLLKMYPERFYRDGAGHVIFCGETAADIDFLEEMIHKYRYYDGFAIWSPVIDLDKKITAGIVDALGAKSCLELGCFSGAVLSVLNNIGIETQGVEISHRAFIMAQENIYQNIKYGTLLDLQFDRTFDAFLAMDVLEHLNPAKLDDYIAKISRLLKPTGFAYINSPMFGCDRIFDTVFSSYIDEWVEVADSDNWRHVHCDEMGWPVHGHLIWASPAWWEDMFRKHGLVRDTAAELVVQDVLADFFLKHAPARKSLFILRHHGTPLTDTLQFRTRLRERVSDLLLAEGLISG